MEDSDKDLVIYTEQRDREHLLLHTDPRTGKRGYIDLRTGLPAKELYEPVTTSHFSNDLADLICDMVREGMSVSKICREYNIQQSVFYAWVAIFPEFKKRLYEARKQRADHHFSKVLDLADMAIGASKEEIQGIKLAIDTHKWAAEKSDPERFAKVKEEGNTSSNITINLQTGVLDRQPPKDIVVDQFGNFQGFGNEYMERDSEQRSELVDESEPRRERFQEWDDRREEAGTTGEETKEE